MAGEDILAKAFGLQLGQRLSKSELLSVWRARDAAGRDVALNVLSDAAPEAVRSRFAVAVSLASGLQAPGVLRVHEVSVGGEAFVSDLWTTGTAKDLPALKWPLRRRLEFLRRAAEALDAMHRGNMVHGALASDAVLIDDDLHPVLAGMGLAPNDAAEPKASDDIAALGRLIEEIAGADATPEVADIVRQCTVRVAELRFASAADVVAAIKTAIDRLPVGETAGVRPSTPPPRSPQSVRPPAPAKRESSIDGLRKRLQSRNFRTVVGAVGAAILVAALGTGYFGGARAQLVLYVATFAGGVLATLLVPALRAAPLRTRVGLILVVVTALVFLDPLTRLSRLGAMQRMHGSDAATRAAVAEVLRLNRDLRGASLRGADLSAMDFTGVDFRGADLSSANLSRSNLFAAQLAGTALDGANLAGADLQRSTLNEARGVRSASCDADTHPPSGWRCSGGLLAPAGSKP